ncbi:Uncharacterized protein dnm_000310 [Desulfonema magnum]|uniref:Uncharacterized protein n=1 Tax=Desulfonema magnum TaxID=45655 RepID=A0A975BF58_9BACT|nr:Uncharacterized protein dnm_000310 [Desulfonema magnum]
MEYISSAMKSQFFSKDLAVHYQEGEIFFHGCLFGSFS